MPLNRQQLHRRPRERRAEARPRELLSAALEVFSVCGFAGARLEDVAARAGVSKGTVYLYYKNKEELFKAVVRESCGAPLAGARELIAASSASSAELLERLFRFWRTLSKNSPVSFLPKLIIAEAGNFPELRQIFAAEIDAPRQAMLEALLRRGIERGDLAPLPVAETARYLTAPMLLLALFENPHGGLCPPGFDGDAYFENSLRLMLAGLDTARPARALESRSVA